MGRAPCCEKIGIKKGRWTAEEDELLSKYIEANGEGSWRSLPKNAGLKRCGKSCRLRWINYLRTDLKRGNITPEEEDIIIKMHISLGNRWSLIAAHLPGRTDNEIKNYWNSHLSRRIQSFRRPVIESPPKIMIDIVKMKSESRRRGRTSRAAMKKNIIKNNPQKIQPIVVKKVFVNKTEGEESIASGIIPSSPALKEEPLKDDKECQNTLVEGPNLANENIGIIFKASEEGESVRSSSLNGDSEDGLLGPYQGLESSMLFGEEIIMGEGALNSSGVLPLNEEKHSGGVISSLSEEGQLGLLLGCSSSNGIMTSSEEGESGGMSSSNGAAESSEWYSSCAMTSCFEDDCWVNWDWEAGVVEGSKNNYNFISNEGEELLTWLWDNNDR